MAEPVETKIRWGQVGIGHVLLKEGRKWTVIDARMPDQYEYGKTGWFRIQAARGEEHALPPRSKRLGVTALIDPEADPISPAYASDGDRAAALLETILGAEEVAWKDQATGEIWCPIEYWGDETATAGEKDLRHLQVAHGIDTGAMDPRDLKAVLAIHTRAHKTGDPLSKGGFTHRHVPEDLSIL